MKRRRFLYLTAGGLAAAGAGAAGGLWLFCPGRDESLTARRQLHAFASSMQGVGRAGRAWLEVNPGIEPGATVIESLGLQPDELLTRRELLVRLEERVTADFEQNRLFVHEGWQLSATEARLAALHAALHGPDVSEANEPTFDNAPEGSLIDVKHFTPQIMEAGQPFQGEGIPQGVIWFGTAGMPAPRMRLVIRGRQLPISATDRGFSSRLPEAIIGELGNNPGEHDLWLYDPVEYRRQKLGTLTVREVTRKQDGFCAVDRWGPESTTAGETFNTQPDGASALWIRVPCFPESTVVTFGGVEIPTTLRPGDGLITTHITDHSIYANPGEYPVELLDRETGAREMVGSFIVR